MASTAKLTRKGMQTRALILETALASFRERGYEETTMRLIAEEAGTSLGNTYHYFPSKEHLVQAFYYRVHEEHVAASRHVLDGKRRLGERLLGAMYALLDVIEPYHRFSGVLFKTAGDPKSPLSPFSPESSPARQAATALFADVVDGSTARVPEDLRAELPNLLWLYHMGVILFWIHDSSKERARTRRLVERTVDLVDRAIGLAGVPLLSPVRKVALGLLAELKSTGGESDPRRLERRVDGRQSPELSGENRQWR